MSLNKEYIKNCLITGFSATQIADALGVTPSAITQFCTTNGIYEEVSAAMVARHKAAQGIDERLARIEEKAAKALEQQLALIADPMKLLKILQVANAAKRRSIPGDVPVATGAPVPLSLPQHITANFHFNTHNEAIAIGDRALVTLPATEVSKLLASKKPKEVSNDPAHNW